MADHPLPSPTLERREFVRFLLASPLFVSPFLTGCRAPYQELSDVTNVMQLKDLARAHLSREAYDFLSDGADDGLTLRANREAFTRWKIRARRLRDVTHVDTEVELLGERLASPILLAPMGSQGIWHPEAELVTARAAAARDHRLIVSTLSTEPVEAITAAVGQAPWFQLYPTTDREITRRLLARAEAAGCRVVVLTVDTPVVGNRESQRGFLQRLLESGEERLGNLEGLGPLPPLIDASMTWDMIAWLRDHTSMQVLVKGIVTHEDAVLCVQHGARGLIVSNHGGRQEESGRGTIECLPEVVEAVSGRMPVLIDGGFRRGTDVFKALALGADAVCIGRPYGWGLAAGGQAGVELALFILQEELVRIMQLVGTTAVSEIHRDHVQT